MKLAHTTKADNTAEMLRKIITEEKMRVTKEEMKKKSILDGVIKATVSTAYRWDP